MAALLRQEFHNNQGNNDCGEHVNESSRGQDARNDGFTEETKQPVEGQDQNDQIKQGNLLLSGPDVTRSDIPGDTGWLPIVMNADGSVNMSNRAASEETFISIRAL